MNKFYISTLSGHSGISSYSRDFYKLVLKDRGYEFIDSNQPLISILSRVASKDLTHIEIGIFQKNEIDILLTMLRANYRNITVTLHDAPLLKYPFFEFRNPVLNALSKLLDIFTNSFGAPTPYLQKIKKIYALSHKGRDRIRRRYGIDHAHYLPHIVDTRNFEITPSPNRNLVYFGFIGKNKGLEYALRLHQKLLEHFPDIKFYVIGRPLEGQEQYYHYLKNKYSNSVIYKGFLEHSELDRVFSEANFAVLLFKDYHFFSPASGSLLYSLQKGKVLFTNPVNAIPEMIENGKNGFYLSGKLTKDIPIAIRILQDSSIPAKMHGDIYQYLLNNHAAEVVNQHFSE